MYLLKESSIQMFYGIIRKINLLMCSYIFTYPFSKRASGVIMIGISKFLENNILTKKNVCAYKRHRNNIVGGSKIIPLRGCSYFAKKNLKILLLVCSWIIRNCLTKRWGAFKIISDTTWAIGARVSFRSSRIRSSMEDCNDIPVETRSIKWRRRSSESHDKFLLTFHLTKNFFNPNLPTLKTTPILAWYCDKLFSPLITHSFIQPVKLTL